MNINTLFDDRDFEEQAFEQLQADPGEILSGHFTDCLFFNCTLAAAVLQNCTFSRCTFRECDLSLAELPGSVFPSAVFEKSKVIGIDWTRANWHKIGLGKLAGFFDCSLSFSTFIGLDLSGMPFKNCVAHEVDFRDANLSKANFSGTDLAKTIFGNTNLTAADLSQARNYDIDAQNNVLTQAKFSLPEAIALLHSMDIDLSEDN